MSLALEYREPIRWPWVTRSRLEYEQRQVKLLKAMLAEAHDDNKTQDERYDVLVKTIVEMKRDGFEPAPKTIELVEEEKLPDEIWQAIMEVSAQNTRDYYTNMAHAHEAIDQGVPHDQIIQQIVYGQEVDL
jgi:ribosome maturation protein Sdo1